MRCVWLLVGELEMINRLPMTIKILFLARERSELLYVSIRSKYLILYCYNYFRQVCKIKWPKLNMYRFDGKWKSIFSNIQFDLKFELRICFRWKVEESMWWKLKNILRIGCQWINETRNAKPNVNNYFWTKCVQMENFFWNGKWCCELTEKYGQADRWTWKW